MADDKYGRPSSRPPRKFPARKPKEDEAKKDNRPTTARGAERAESRPPNRRPERNSYRQTTGSRSPRPDADRPRSGSARTDQTPRRPPQRRDSGRRQQYSSRKPLPRKMAGSGLKLEVIALPLITIMAATALMYYGAPILVPLVGAITLAYILSPAVALVKRARIPHVLAVLLVMSIGAGALGLVVYVIIQESVGLAVDMPGYYEVVKGWGLDLLAEYSVLQESSANLLPVLDESLLAGVSFTDFSDVGGYLFKGIGSVLLSVLSLVMILLLTLFLLLDEEMLRKRLVLVLGDDPRVSGSIIDGINEQIRGFLLVKFLTTVAMAVIFTVGLLLFQVNYAYVWGPLAGVLNLIPYVGAFIGMVPPVIIAAIQAGEISTPAWVLLFMVVVQLLESNVITPKLVGNKMNLNLLAVLVATVYWGWLWGMTGVLLAVPITGAIKAVCSHIDQLRPIAILLSGEANLNGVQGR